MKTEMEYCTSCGYELQEGLCERCGNPQIERECGNCKHLNSTELADGSILKYCGHPEVMQLDIDDDTYLCTAEHPLFEPIENTLNK